MEERIEKAISEFASLLKEDARVKALKEKEALMMEDEEAIHLANRLHEAEETYSFVVSTNDKKEIDRAKKNLHQAKLALDMHPSVKAYNEAFVAVRDLYMQIDDLFFGPYRKKVISGKDEK